MAEKVTVTGLTAKRMQEIEAESITKARKVGDHLVLTTFGGKDIDVGNIVGAQGVPGDKGPAGSVDLVNGHGGPIVKLDAEDVGAIPAGVTASMTVAGVIEIATLSEMNAGTDNTRAITPALIAKLSAMLIPTGSILPTAFNGTDPGFALCNGQALNRIEDAALFDKIGTIYGAGDGKTTFNTPNLQGRVIAMISGSQAEFSSMGKTGGAMTHSHYLSDAGQAIIAISASDSVVKQRRVAMQATRTTHAMSKASSGNSVTATSDTLEVGAALQGQTDSTSGLQPYMALRYQIKR